MNVTTTVTLAPALVDAPTTMTKLVADDMVHDVTAVPPTVEPHCAVVIKLVPVTVMVLPT